MSEALEKIEQYRYEVLQDLLNQCTEEQQQRFYRGYRITDVKEIPLENVGAAVTLCGNALRANRRQERDQGGTMSSEKRPVEVLHYGGGYYYSGIFHGFGAGYDEYEAGPGNFTVAIIEKDNGEVVLINPTRIRFTDKETP